MTSWLSALFEHQQYVINGKVDRSVTSVRATKKICIGLCSCVYSPYVSLSIMMQNVQTSSIVATVSRCTKTRLDVNSLTVGEVWWYTDTDKGRKGAENFCPRNKRGGKIQSRILRKNNIHIYIYPIYEEQGKKKSQRTQSNFNRFQPLSLSEPSNWLSICRWEYIFWRIFLFQIQVPTLPTLVVIYFGWHPSTTWFDNKTALVLFVSFILRSVSFISPLDVKESI